MTHRLSSVQQLKADFEAWTKRMESNGYVYETVDCDECMGNGEIPCPHCGEGMVDCEECEGTGEVMFPTLHDYIALRKAEEVLLKLWSDGEGIPTSRNGFSNQILDPSLEELFKFLHQDELRDTSHQTAILEIKVNS